MISLLSVTKIEFLRDCECPAERLLHPNEGCDCSEMVPTPFSKGEVLEEYELYKTDISGLKLGEDFKVLEVT